MKRESKARGSARARRPFLVMAGALLCGIASGAAPEALEGSGPLAGRLAPGPGWLHRFTAGMKHAPQFAVWIEDEGGRYGRTVYATRKIATEGWAFNKGNRRKEALPYWCHRRGVRYPDGLYLPTKAMPLVDALTSASPKGRFAAFFDPPEGMRRFWVYIEVNHSADFNAAYPRDAVEGGSGWSGGPEGSGQPALVYRVRVDLDAATVGSALEYAGHASPDGSDGKLYPGKEGIDSALRILGGMAVTRG